MGEDRPLGTIIMAIIMVVVGIAFVAIGAIAIMGFLNGLLVTMAADPAIGVLVAPLITMLTPYITIIGIIVIVGGIVNFIGAIAVLSKTTWGWTLSVIISLVYVVVIIGIVFLWYLFQDDIKTAFGKY